MTKDQTERLRARLKRVENLSEFVREGAQRLPSKRTIERFAAGHHATLPGYVSMIAAEMARQQPKLRVKEGKE